MTQNQELRSFAKDSLYNLLRMAGLSLFALGSSVIISRVLGRENKGFYELAVLFPVILQTILNVGVVSATLYYVARGDYDLKDVVRGNMALTIWLSLIGLLCGGAIVLFGRDIFFPGVPPDYLILSLLLLPLLHLRSNMNAIFWGLKDFRTYTLTEIMTPGSTFLLLLIFVVLGEGNTLAALGCLFTANLISIAGLYVLLKYRLGYDPLSLLSFNMDPGYFRATFSYGIRSHGLNVAVYLLTRVDALLINAIGGGAASVGIYSIAVMLSERIWSFTGFTAYVMAPRIASWTDNEAQRSYMTMLVTRYTLWASIGMALLIVILGEWAIVLVFGEPFRPAATALIWLLPGIVMYNVARVVSVDITGRGKPEISSLHSAIALGINMVCNLLLIPRFDFLGAALASSIAYTYFGIALVVIFCHMHNVSWLQFWLPTYEDGRRLNRLTKSLLARIATAKQK